VYPYKHFGCFLFGDVGSVQRTDRVFLEFLQVLEFTLSREIARLSNSFVAQEEALELDNWGIFVICVLLYHLPFCSQLDASRVCYSPLHSLLQLAGLLLQAIVFCRESLYCNHAPLCIISACFLLFGLSSLDKSRISNRWYSDSNVIYFGLPDVPFQRHSAR